MKKLSKIYLKNLESPITNFLCGILGLIILSFALTALVLFFAFLEKYPRQSCLYFFGGWGLLILIIILIKIFIDSYKEYKEQ